MGTAIIPVVEAAIANVFSVVAASTFVVAIVARWRS